ncbi:ATP-dependent endonuclease [Oscillochloris sp. ZM17-4]|uniref:AAA family ATPase n=1 Tax=Oscillochloris sp. ZM17-4 TaxID=2866714 RepID=UPI001C730008|nr:ATP-dependent endonuclease [Oscillochloris sp. ZM17-4]
MRIKTVQVQRFRSIYNATLECDNLTALVGANGAGKSTFLRALDIFYKPNARVERNDYYADDPSEPIRITVTYVDLSPVEQAALDKYYHSQQLVVEKRIEWVGEKAKQAYYGQMRRHRPFLEQILNKTTAGDRRTSYSDLRKQAPYTELPSATSLSNDQRIRDALIAWELSHPDACELLSSETQFFGFNQAGAERLERFTRFLLVPAMRDANADATDERGSLINELVDMVIRKSLADRAEVQRLQAEASSKLKEIQDLTNSDLDEINKRLNQTLHYFAPNTDVGVSWQPPSITLPLPKVRVQLSEDGYPTTTERTGHGVQRAFIISLLQDLAMRQGNQGEISVPIEELATRSDTATSEDAITLAEPAVDTGTIGGVMTEEQPALILAIEEPELFQHPTRQRHFARILHNLATGQVSGVANSIQVIYCTHSPIFVDIDRFEQIRVVAKQTPPRPSTPRQTAVRATSRAIVTGAGINHAKLAAMLTASVNEGFFADFVVLVEGEGDRALLQGVAQLMDISLEAYGIAVVAVDGKGSLAKPLIIFSHLQIPTFVVWDNDSNQTKESDRATSSKLNRELLSLCNCYPEDWPTGVHETCAVFNPKLEEVIHQDVCTAGISWDDLELEVYTITGEKGPKSLKRHAVVSHLVRQAATKGCAFPTVQTMLVKICERAGIPLPNNALSTEVHP